MLPSAGWWRVLGAKDMGSSKRNKGVAGRKSLLENMRVLSRAAEQKKTEGGIEN